MINVICFSKDRAAQLDLTLSSYKKYFKEWKDQKLTIIYKYSNPRFKEGYNKVKALHPEFIWMLEDSFRANTVGAYSAGFKKYTAFLVDDDIFIDHFSLEDAPVKKFMEDTNVCCVSPRLHPSVNFCYTQNAPQPSPTFIEPGVWNWQTPGLKGDWCYPPSIASFHIFRTEDLKFLENMMFKGPNSLEGGMDNNWPRNRPLMTCFDSAKCICSTNNKVQIENTNHCENTDPVEFLNEEFLSGKRLSVDANHQFKSNMCHGPCKYIFEECN